MRDFQTESGFMKHVCAARERMDEMKSPRGAAAYAHYGEWMRLQRRSVPAAEKFMDSRQYKHFIKFVDWSTKTAIPNPNQFIRVMVETQVQPPLWCRDTTYSMYLQWYDNAYPPENQFVESFDKLRSLAEEHGVPLSQIYDTLGPEAIAKLVRRRKLSPWLLATSQKFLRWTQALPQLDRELMNDAVNFMAFSQKINQHQELAMEFRKACEAEHV